MGCASRSSRKRTEDRTGPALSRGGIDDPSEQGGTDRYVGDPARAAHVVSGGDVSPLAEEDDAHLAGIEIEDQAGDTAGEFDQFF